MQLNSFYPVIGTKKLAESRDFYVQHFGYVITFEADWYISLLREDDGTQLALLDYEHPSVPDGFHKPAQGLLLNYEVEDVDLFYKHCKDNALPIHRDIRDEDWGQRHFITGDPNGVLLDIIKLIPPKGAFVEQYTDIGKEEFDA